MRVDNVNSGENVLLELYIQLVNYTLHSAHVTTIHTIVGEILALYTRSIHYCMNTQPTLCTLYIENMTPLP